MTPHAPNIHDCVIDVDPPCARPTTRRSRTDTSFSDLELWIMERLFTAGPQTAKQLAAQCGRAANTIRPRLAELAAVGAVRVAGNVMVGKRREQSWEAVV